MIIAVDFDGVLCEDRFPDIGAPNPGMVSAVRQAIERGHEVVLWTCRVGARLTEAVRWCEDHGLRFCAVNENAPSNRAKYEAEYPEGTRKVYADLYVEDHDAMWVRNDRLHGWFPDRCRATSLEAAAYELCKISENGGVDNE